jgi:hypothetical protein
MSNLAIGVAALYVGLIFLIITVVALNYVWLHDLDRHD